MENFFKLFLVGVGALALPYMYLRVVRHYRPAESVDVIDATVHEIARKIKQTVQVYQRREVAFYSIPSVVLEAYIHAVTDELGLCRVCKFGCWQYHSRDIFSLQMQFYGFNSSFTPDEMKQLLTATLQNQLIAYFGTQSYPLVYWAKAERPVVVFWIAANLQGNTFLKQRLGEDYYADIPNEEDLVDE